MTTPSTDTVPVSEIDVSPAPVSPTLDQQIAAVAAAQPSASEINTSAQPVSGSVDPAAAYDESKFGVVTPEQAAFSAKYNGSQDGTVPPSEAGAGANLAGAAVAGGVQSLVKNAQSQLTNATQRGQVANGDWRVRLSLAPQSNYLYNATNPGILQPLQVTNGIIFPYTPAIDTTYRASYQTYDLTHSNYRGYFYQNSYVDAISLKCTFTAQNTADANYLLAVITFLKSVTKMFYGQDAQRGAPPPLVFLSGLGDYQFNGQPALVSQFQYNLPDNVDYIRAGAPSQVGLNLTSIRNQQSVATNNMFGSLNRLAAALLPKGAITSPPAPPTLGLNRPTYVPTKIDINLTLLPVQSRQQVSKQFSLKGFANGDLIKGGFW